MPLLLIPIFAAEILFWVALAYCITHIIMGLRSRNWLRIGLWAVILMVPFIFYQYKQIEADAKEAARLQDVAALPRNAPPQVLPPLLEVHGAVTEQEALIYMGALGFREVAVLEHPRRGKIYGRFVRLAQGCEAHARAHYERWRERRRLRAPDEKDKTCLETEWKTVLQDRSGIAAIVYRQGNHASLRVEGNNWHDGAYEIASRTADGTRLIAYWERPFITRPSWPGPMGYLYPGNSDATKYKKPNRFDFFLEAMVRG